MRQNILSFEIRVKPLSPVHIGIGNEFVGRGAYHLYDEGRQLALLQPRRLAGRLLDHFGDQGQIAAKVQDFMERDAYPPAIARDIESGALATRRMSVHPGAKSLVNSPAGLKVISALANGLPYIPGSSVKGALRTAWLDWQTQQPDAYSRFQEEASRAKSARPKDADDKLMGRKQTAERLTGTNVDPQPQNRDLFRAVQVSDLLPDRTEKLTRAFAVLSMSYMVDSYVRPSDRGYAGAQAWECLNPQAGATYVGTVTVDLDLLSRFRSQDKDAANLISALSDAASWDTALSGYGSRIFSTERQHLKILRGLPDERRQGIKIRETPDDDLIFNWSEKMADRKTQLMPVGMGAGLLAHSLLGVKNPLYPSDPEGDLAEYLGDELIEEDGEETLLERVLSAGKQTNGYQFSPAPKSRRVTGEFRKQPGDRPYAEMRAERSLGWTELTLKVRGG
ncbi:type III-A CRISPR-associated RAMP protein Csm5 [Deinococcus kurensis]|uniref:type III-A CRISPR-associated RAMP protein Csm5 n=1 Tax=Deinococcus kurensis TaxID=2662757 RepID=UPI001391DA0B|nr:type III-A CRISPR-associated RAMP protein Csm5 [Deinococcus kurensis]